MGETWNNIAKKQQGLMKFNAPDYKCKNPQCTGVIWPPRGTKPQPVAQYGQPPAPQPVITREPIQERDYTAEARGKVRNSVAVAFIGQGILFEDAKPLMGQWVTWIMGDTDE